MLRLAGGSSGLWLLRNQCRALSGPCVKSQSAPALPLGPSAPAAATALNRPLVSAPLLQVQQQRLGPGGAAMTRPTLITRRQSQIWVTLRLSIRSRAAWSATSSHTW